MTIKSTERTTQDHLLSPQSSHLHSWVTYFEHLNCKQAFQKFTVWLCKCLSNSWIFDSSPCTWCTWVLLSFVLPWWLPHLSNYVSCDWEWPTNSECLQWWTIKGFFTLGNKRLKFACFAFISILKAPAMESCCGTLPKVGVRSIFFLKSRVCSVITITPLEDTTREHLVQRREQAYKFGLSELSLAGPSRAAEPSSYIHSWNTQMITRIQGMNSRKFKQIPSACSYQGLYK